MQLGIVASKPFQEALAKLAKAQLPISSTLKVRKLLKQVTEEVKEFYDLQGAIAKEYGKKDDKGEIVVNEDQTITLDETRKNEWQAKLIELANHEVELAKVKVSELGTTLEMSALELSVLEGLLED